MRFVKSSLTVGQVAEDILFFGTLVLFLIFIFKNKAKIKKWFAERTTGKSLERDRASGRWFGVCAGISEFLEFPVFLVRAIFCFLAPLAVVPYFIMAIILPIMRKGEEE